MEIKILISPYDDSKLNFLNISPNIILLFFLKMLKENFLAQKDPIKVNLQTNII